ncbi:MAG: hypothetical protein Tsb0020_23780 [Haliangiales bacterium]
MSAGGPELEAGAQCGETAGFLFRHACQRAASAACRSCKKPVCEEHAFEVSGDAGEQAGEVLCVRCRRALVEDDDASELDDEFGFDSYDPYFYATLHYSNYGYYGPESLAYHDAAGADPNDFSAADGVSLIEDGGDFEQDMGAS